MASASSRPFSFVGRASGGVSVPTRSEIGGIRELLGISSRDVVMSVDGYLVDASADLSPTPNYDYQRHVIEIRRNGRLVVISLRKTRT